MVIPLIYDRLGSFDRGLASVVVGNREGVINRDGQWVVPAEHGATIRISDHVFLVAEPPYADYRGPQWFKTFDPWPIVAYGKQ